MSFYSYKNANAECSPGVVNGNILTGLNKRVCIQVKNVYDSCLSQQQLDDALAQAKDQLAAAKEAADLHGVLTKELVAQLVQAQNFEMPAGFVSDGDVSWIVNVGDKVKGVEIPDDVNASTSYPIAALTTSANAATAAAFVAYVLSPAGSSVLTAAGFQQP
jgi:ABC-type molybdate transport system substrate-binding protein